MNELTLTPCNMAELKGCINALSCQGTVRIQFPSGGTWTFPDEPNDDRRAERPKRIARSMRGLGNLFGAVDGLKRLNPPRTWPERVDVPEVPEGFDAIPNVDEWLAGWPLTLANGTSVARDRYTREIDARKLYADLRRRAVHPPMPKATP